MGSSIPASKILAGVARYLSLAVSNNQVLSLALWYLSTGMSWKLICLRKGMVY